MKKSFYVAVVIMLAVAGGGAGYGLYHWTHLGQQPPAAKAPAAAPGGVAVAHKNEPRPDFSLKDLDGKSHDISDWNGKVVLLNFWATWCPPCRHEIPAFIKLQKEFGPKGLQVVGVAIDQKNLVEEFRDTVGINYPLLVGDMNAVDVSKRYGNQYGEIPYTVFIDRQGRIAHIQRGEISEQQAAKIIRSLL
ncbi:MAG: TlpA disulfide reductase family protein [Gammaproteobacteria bacterium]